ncbi:hypothetical protein D3C81_1997630 [compost metagenome]
MPYRTKKVFMLPAAIAQHAVLQALLQGFKNAGGGGEIHIGDGERQQICGTKPVGDVVPLGAPGTVTIYRGRKIKHVKLRTRAQQAAPGGKVMRWPSVILTHLSPIAPAGQ